MQPDTRNPVLARALETLGITENRYSGIPTIQGELHNAGMQETVFLNSRNKFAVTFYNGSRKEVALTDSTLEEKILASVIFHAHERKVSDS